MNARPPIGPLVRLFLAALGGLSCALFARAATGFPLVTRFAVPELNATGWGLSVIQTPDGVMQFGGRQLVSYDGDRWTISEVGNGYGVYDLALAPDGKLWTAAVGEIGWFQRGASGWEFHSLKSQLAPEDADFGTAWQVFVTTWGVVFACDEKVLCWDGHKFAAWPMTLTRRVRGLRAGDRVFVQHKPTGLYEVTRDGPVLFLPASVIGETAGLFLLEQSGRDFTLLSNDGFFRWDGQKLQPIEGSGSDYVRKHKNLSQVLRLPDGRLALGTTTDGVRFLDRDGNLAGPANELGLAEGYVSRLFVDREGALWVVSNYAVYRAAIDSATRILDSRAQLGAQRIRGVARDAAGMVFVTSDNLFRLTPGGQTVEASPAEERNLFYDAQTSPAGVLVGGLHTLSRVNGRTLQVLHETKMDVSLVSPWRDGRHYFVENRDVGSLADDNTVRPVFKGLPDLATSIDADRAQRIWVGTEAMGVWRISPAAAEAKLEKISGADGLPSVSGPSRVAVAPNGTVVVFNRAGAWFRAETGARFEPLEGFPSGLMVSSRPAADSAGRLWCAVESLDSRQYAIGRISFAAARPRWEAYSVEGLAHIGAPRSLYVEEVAGEVPKLWIGGLTGLLCADLGTGLAAPRPQAPLLHAFAVSAAGERRPLSRELRYSTATIDFEFAEPDFAYRPLLRLETRIDGIDDDWVPAGADSRRTLTALRDGDYTFRVRAVAETGVASEPTVLSFRVAPPWWRTAPAILGVIFALLPAGYGVYRLRLRTLHRRTLELEAKVRQRTEQLEQANAAKTQFVANMSHDIRNPLNGIVGLALALEDTRLDSRQREIVATLRECTTYLSSLVDDVLDFASIEAGRVELRPGPFVPRELLRSIVTTTKTDTAESGAQLVVDIDPALPAILAGDAGRIQQILVNYVSNALKYAGGTIHLTATIPLGSTDEVEFAVADGGPGISAAEQATLFTKFTRLAGARQHEIPGAGLGLAACRLLADIMGGSVGVVSQPGQGARFFLRLPLARAEIPEAPADGELPNTTVLLVEDTDYNALAATAVLRRLGLTCERARTGEEALQLFAAKRFNLVLLDRNLPDLDGTEIARRMRAMETDGAQSILLAVTAYCTAEDRKLCLESGMDAFVGKPLTPEKLRRVLLAAGRRMLATATFDAAPEPAPADVDLSLLNYIAEGDGGLDAQLDRFLASLAEHQAQLEAADLADLKSLETAAHRVLGQARIVGAAALARVATELQQAAHAGEAARCVELRPQVRTEVAALTAALRHRRSGALTS